MTEVIVPPAGELFSETNDNSVAILLSNDTARVLLAERKAAVSFDRLSSSSCDVFAKLTARITSRKEDR